MDNDGGPQPQRDGHRHSFHNKVHHGSALEKAIPKIKEQKILEHFKIPDVDGLIKPEPFFNFGNDFQFNGRAQG